MSDENNKQGPEKATNDTHPEQTKTDRSSHSPTTAKKALGGLHWVFATTGLVIGAVVTFFITSSTGLEASGVGENEAVTEAHALYEETLLSPSTAEWAPVEDTETEYLGDDRYYTKSYVDAQNANAVQAREEFEIWYEYDTDEDEWVMEDYVVTNY